MSRKSRTTLTFTVTLPLPQKASAKDAALFLRECLENQVTGIRDVHAKSPFAFLSTKEVIIKQTGKETVYL